MIKKVNKEQLCRCDVCGKFIGVPQFEKDEVIIEFTPDTQFTEEKYEYTHRQCMSNI